MDHTDGDGIEEDPFELTQHPPGNILVRRIGIVNSFAYCKISGKDKEKVHRQRAALEKIGMNILLVQVTLMKRHYGKSHNEAIEIYLCVSARISNRGG